MLLSNPEPGNAEGTCLSDATPIDHLMDETFYCDYSHPAITDLSVKIVQGSARQIDTIENIFLFVRDRIVFGGDHWQVKASETLLKGYGACYNKNILMIALLRAANIHSKLMANPVHKSFTKPSVGGIHVLFSDPFYHCFSHVWIESRWIALDPTLDRTTYATFFEPAGVAWRIDWDRTGDMLLYSESIAGAPRQYHDIDRALNNNLDSYFLFRHEPKFLRGAWLSIGNKQMWKKTQRFPLSSSSERDRPRGVRNAVRNL